MTEASENELIRYWLVLLLYLCLSADALPASAQLRSSVEREPARVSVAAESTGYSSIVADVSINDDTCLPRANQRSLDVRGLALLYCTQSKVIRTPLRLAHQSAYPVFYGGVPAAWLGVWAIRGPGDFTDAYRLTITQGATFLTVTVLKRLFGRPRPFMSVDGVKSRSASYGRSIDDGQFASLPSGHASLSVALATSWSLSHPYWYVIAPSAVWAGSVSLSRPYLGVHYPSDILFGAVLGAGIAVAVHLLRDSITPAVLKPNSPVAVEATGPKVSLLKLTF